jgi:type IV secretion system protein VirB4
VQAQPWRSCRRGFLELHEGALGPLALAFVGASDKESLATIQHLESKLGDGWVHEWLAGRGLTLNDYGVAA